LDLLDVDRALNGADLVIVHEWNDPGLVAKIGHHRSRNPDYRLFFHDTHHRMATDPEAMSGYDLRYYDGVLAYGRILQSLYEQSGRVQHAWTWHEAADVRVFRPNRVDQQEGDLVWIGNWGDEERTAELQEFLIQPSRSLGLKSTVYGVRYPKAATETLQAAGIKYCGWLPNFEVPRVFGRYRFTVHVPRRPYVKALQGIPTIRPFESLACGIPLVCSPWKDLEGLFTPGKDFLLAHSGKEMEKHMNDLSHDSGLCEALAKHGLHTIRTRHTCGHRVDQLLAIYEETNPVKTSPGANKAGRPTTDDEAGSGLIGGPASLLEPAGAGTSTRTVFAQRA
jgi:spore maturation protein CgeB